jgi:glyoxylate reductase
LLKESDFISIHVPLTKETFHLIDEKELRLMKNTAVLINTARGPIIHEKALVKALSERWIFGAGLDVYEEEPRLSEGLKGLDNVVLQPHTGSGTIETRTKMALMAAENMIIGLKGGVPPNCINKEVFKKKTIT